jgi:hypothetical protein
MSIVTYDDSRPSSRVYEGQAAEYERRKHAKAMEQAVAVYDEAAAYQEAGKLIWTHAAQGTDALRAEFLEGTPEPGTDEYWDRVARTKGRSAVGNAVGFIAGLTAGAVGAITMGPAGAVGGFTGGMAAGKGLISGIGYVFGGEDPAIGALRAKETARQKRKLLEDRSKVEEDMKADTIRHFQSLRDIGPSNPMSGAENSPLGVGDTKNKVMGGTVVVLRKRPRTKKYY